MNGSSPLDLLPIWALFLLTFAIATGATEAGFRLGLRWQRWRPQAGDAAGALEWHYIGPIQSNKTRAIATRFDWVQSLDRLRIAERLAAQRPAASPPLNVLLEVNVSGEASKSGVAPAEAAALAHAVAALPKLRLRGLMAIPEPAADLAAQRAPHRTLRELFHALRGEGLALDTLSMGMS